MKHTLIALAAACTCLTAVSAHAAEKLHLCTAAQNGNYYFAGAQIAQQARGTLDVDVLETRGSMENLERIEKGECDGAIVQSDAFTAYQRQYPKSILKLERSAALYNELVHLLCNRARGITKITKLTGKDVVAVGKNGAGSAVTWDGFVTADAKTYKPVQTAPIDGERALAKVADGTDVQCMLFTAGLNTPFIKDVATAYKGKIVLVPTDDSDIKDVKDAKGGRLYEYVEIPSGMYKGIQDGTFSSAVPTIAVTALLVVNSDWADAHDREYSRLLEAVRKALPTIRQRVGQ